MPRQAGLFIQIPHNHRTIKDNFIYTTKISHVTGPFPLKYAPGSGMVRQETEAVQ